MTIGIDIDDTMTNSSEKIKEYLEKYDEEYSHHLISNFANIIRGFLIDDITKQFFNKYAETMGNEIELKENVKEVIDKLRNDGYKIVIVTARSDNFYKDAQKFCEEYLKRNNINYDKLVTQQTFKLECCINEKIDLFIDDALDTVEDLNNRGIKTILFNSVHNRDKETSVKRVDNWLELYDLINNL